jgi:hypothetical protein
MELAHPLWRNLSRRLPKIKSPWISAVVLLGLWAATPAAQAGSLTWKYHLDSNRDGDDKGIVGQTSRFELLGSAYAQDGKKSYIVIYSNIDNEGVIFGKKQIRVFTGDLVLDFTGQGNLSAANGSPNLYTVKFVPNESNLQLGQIGVGSTLKSVHLTNYGFATYQEYYNKLKRARTFDGRFAAPYMGTTPQLNTGYFQAEDSTLSVTESSQSVIDNAVRIITNPVEIEQLGVDTKLPGSTPSSLTQITVIEIDNSQLPSGDFIAALLTECGNDSFAFNAGIQPIAATPPVETTTPPTTITTVPTTTTPTYTLSALTPASGGVSTGLIVGGSALALGLLLLLLLDSGDDSVVNGGGGNGGGGNGGNGGGGNGGGNPRPQEVPENNNPIALAILSLAAFGWRKKKSLA